MGLLQIPNRFIKVDSATTNNTDSSSVREKEWK